MGESAVQPRRAAQPQDLCTGIGAKQVIDQVAAHESLGAGDQDTAELCHSTSSGRLTWTASLRIEDSVSIISTNRSSRVRARTTGRYRLAYRCRAADPSRSAV